MEALEDERGKGGAPGEAIHIGMIWCVFDHHTVSSMVALDMDARFVSLAPS